MVMANVSILYYKEKQSVLHHILSKAFLDSQIDNLYSAGIWCLNDVVSTSMRR